MAAGDVARGGKYRPSARPVLEAIPVFLDDAHKTVLRMLAARARCRESTYLSQLLHNELERAFEDATGARAGVILARIARGEMFDWSAFGELVPKGTICVDCTGDDCERCDIAAARVKQ